MTKCFDLQNEYMNIDFVDQDHNNYGHQEENQDGEQIQDEEERAETSDELVPHQEHVEPETDTVGTHQNSTCVNIVFDL